MREERRAPATERVKQELVLDALAEAQGLVPSDAHVEADARRGLEGAEDAERLVASDRVRAYVRERLRLQWALLWLAARARGEEWSPPAPGEPTAAPADASAAEELAGVGGAALAPPEAHDHDHEHDHDHPHEHATEVADATSEATPMDQVSREDGMVDI